MVTRRAIALVWLSCAVSCVALREYPAVAVDAAGTDAAPVDVPTTDDVVMTDAVVAMDRVTPNDVVTPSDVVTPNDVVTPTDRVTPSDVVTPMDRVAPSDVVTPTDRVTPVDMVMPADVVLPVDVVTPLTFVAGNACTIDLQCGTGSCLHTPGWTGGYCTRRCRMDGDCGAGAICADDGNIQFCARRCRIDGDCRAGYVCFPLSATDGICFPRCTANPGAICGESQCDAVSGQCSDGTCRTATDCSANSRCAGGLCECTAATDCGPNSACIGGLCGCANDAACGPFGACRGDGTCG